MLYSGDIILCHKSCRKLYEMNSNGNGNIHRHTMTSLCAIGLSVIGSWIYLGESQTPSSGTVVFIDTALSLRESMKTGRGRISFASQLVDQTPNSALSFHCLEFVAIIVQQH